MLTSFAIKGKICNFPSPSHPVSRGRAQSDLAPTPRYLSCRKEQQKPPQLPPRDTCSAHPSHTATTMAGQGNVCPASHTHAFDRSPDHCREDAASYTACRAVPPAQLHLLCNSSIQAAKGTQSSWEANHCPCPTSPESFK